MRTIIFAILIFITCMDAFSQDFALEYKGRGTPGLNKDRIMAARSVTDLCPDLWRKMGLPQKDREELNRRLALDFSQGHFSYMAGRFEYPRCIDYDRLIRIHSFELHGTFHEQEWVSVTEGDQLSAEQKKILYNAPAGSGLIVIMHFSFLPRPYDDPQAATRIMSGGISLTIVPEKEAEFPGGFTAFSRYLNEKVTQRITWTRPDKLARSRFRFSIDENGRVTGPRIIYSSSDPKIDQMLIEAIKKMPIWKPAEDGAGKKLTQEFNIAFGEGC
jgi:TonB family protein